MKKITICLTLLLVLSAGVQAQFVKKAKKIIEKNVPVTGSYTESEAASAIKEALSKGGEKGVALVSKENGYFGDGEIKIPFPQDAKSMEEKLRAIGLGNKVDEVVLSLNRAAEDAASQAKDIFIAAIKEMTLTDAINIVKGNDNAATEYLKTHTTTQLTNKFSPIIEASLKKVNATKYWNDIITTYNKIPLVKKMNPDLTAYVTGKAIDGLFVKVAKEEKQIRENPAERTTELLKKVFGK
jgi:hypothetical protein